MSVCMACVWALGVHTALYGVIQLGSGYSRGSNRVGELVKALTLKPSFIHPATECPIDFQLVETLGVQVAWSWTLDSVVMPP